MTNTDTIQVALARTSYSDRTVRSGHHLIGAGPARKGYAAYTAAGDGLWLGRTVAEALAKIAAL